MCGLATGLGIGLALIVPSLVFECCTDVWIYTDFNGMINIILHQLLYNNY